MKLCGTDKKKILTNLNLSLANENLLQDMTAIKSLAKYKIVLKITCHDGSLKKSYWFTNY